MFLVGFMIGCGLTGTSDDEQVRIQTDRKQYHAEHDDEIRLIVLNQTSNNLFYSFCTQKWLEVLDDNRVIKSISVHQFICFCLCPVTIKPGIQNAYDQIRVSIDHIKLLADTPEHEKYLSSRYTYRIKISLYREELFNEELPDEMRRTNRFNLTGFNEYI